MYAIRSYYESPVATRGGSPSLPPAAATSSGGVIRYDTHRGSYLTYDNKSGLS